MADTKSKAAKPAETEAVISTRVPATAADARALETENREASKEAAKDGDEKLDEGSTIKEYDASESSVPGEITEGVKAEDIPPSGSISEPAAVADIPVDHPAVDDHPRRNQPADSNRIDFNDPGGFKRA